MSDGYNLKAHLFVCTNQKANGASCAAKGAVDLRTAMKNLCQDEAKGWHGKVRVNASGCLGRCEEGITAVLYPKGEWFTKLEKGDTKTLESALAKVLDE